MTRRDSGFVRLRRRRSQPMRTSSILPRIARRLTRPLRRPVDRRRGYRFGKNAKFQTGAASESRPPNRLEQYFDNHVEGPGLFKWRHYFEVYDRHFASFVGKEVTVLEIGVYSGGSLDLWRHYFGPGCHVHGVDIDDGCRTYESDWVKISIGDQADPLFWSEILADRPSIDIIIDDGGHLSHQQITTLEALLPHINPGGVYVCEDVHGVGNEFHHYISGLARNLNAWNLSDPSVLRAAPSEFQRMIGSIHLYPFLVVIERSAHPRDELVAPRHGTEWRPPHARSPSPPPALQY